MKLDVEKWGEFSINSLFDVLLSKGDLKIDEVESGLIPLISSGETNNGVVGYIDSRGDGKAKIFKGNAITIDMFGNAFYQKDDFYAVSHGRVNILMPKFNLNQNIAMFIITLIYKNQYKYSYGRALYSDEAKKMIIKLPINAKGEPDFEFMENYIKSLHYKPLTTKNRPENVPPLNVDKWGEFKLNDIFKCSTTTLSIKDELLEGNTPFISRTALNNGCDGYVEIETKFITKGNCISIGAEGIYAFYQKDDFATGNKIYILRNENLNQYVALFICAVLNQEVYRYSYGRARILSKLENEFIKLPINKGEPDWEFMENYIKSLPYGDKI